MNGDGTDRSSQVCEPVGQKKIPDDSYQRPGTSGHKLYRVKLLAPGNKLEFTEIPNFKQTAINDRSGTVRNHAIVKSLIAQYSSDRIPSIEDFYKDLDESKTYVLTGGDASIVWLGKEVAFNYHKAWQIFEREQPNNELKPFIMTKQGLEVPKFTAAFENWDSDMWLKQSFYEQEREKMLGNNEIDVD